LNRLIYYAGLYAGSAALLKTLGFLLSLWMAASLSVSDYASWGLLYAFQTALTTFGAAGILEAVVGLLASNEQVEQRRKLFGGATGTFAVTMTASIVVAVMLWIFVFGRESASFLTLASVLASGVLLAFVALQAQVIRLEERHFASLAFNFVAPLLALVGSAVWFAAERSAQSYFFGSAVGLAAALAVLWRAGEIQVYRPVLHRKHRNAVIRRLGPYIAVAFFGWLSGYGNNIVVATLFSATEVAQFTFALSVGAVMQLVASSLNQVWSPRFFRITRTESFDSVEQKNRRFYFSQSIVLGTVAALSILLLPPLLNSLGGNLSFYGSMRMELFLVFGAYIILSPWWHCHNYFLAYDRGQSVLNIVLVTSALGIGAWLLLMWVLGPLGIYVGFFCQMVIRSVGIAMYARRFWPVRVTWGGVAIGMLVALSGLWISGI
jgi:O-antigen/teichoic acid export membrane protein